MNQSCPECGGDPEAICNFCGNKPKEECGASMETSSVFLNNVEVQPNGILRNSKGRLIARLVSSVDFSSEHIQQGDTDPYEAQGKNFRVHHPTQPKTQVERWTDEILENMRAIEKCCGYEGLKYFCCEKEGAESCRERNTKNKELVNKIQADHEKNKTYLNRHPIGTFADDIENAPEYIKKSLFGHNFKKVTLLDKIKLYG